MLHLPRGVHPYSVLAFLENGDEIEIARTDLYWGMVQGKWRASWSPAALESLIEAASAQLSCTEGPVAGHVFGATLIHWPTGAQVVCEAGWFTEESEVLIQPMDSLMDAAERTLPARKVTRP